MGVTALNFLVSGKLHIRKKAESHHLKRAFWKSEEIDQNLLELISDYSKIAGYKVNIQKSIPFLSTSKEQVEFEIKYTMPFTLTLLPPNEILRYKSNKVCKRPIWRKLQNSHELNK